MTMALTHLPIHIMPGNLATSPAIETWVRRRLASAFRRYGASMTAIEVHFEDVNGPKRGKDDARCMMEARVNGRTPIAVRAHADDLYSAINSAAKKLGAAVGRAVERINTRARRKFRKNRVRGTDIAIATHPQPAQLATAQAQIDESSDTPVIEPSPRVIVAGYGPVGRALCDELIKRNVPFTVVDTNPATARTQEQLGVHVVCGDVTDPGVLMAAGIETATALAITIPDGDEVVRACAAARKLSPELNISARTTFLSQGLNALLAGANSITVEEIATAKAMAREVLRQMALAGIPMNPDHRTA